MKNSSARFLPLVAALALSGPALARTPVGTFAGYFDLTPPVAGNYTASQSFGNWAGSISGDGNINTGNAPTSVSINAFPPMVPLIRTEGAQAALQFQLFQSVTTLSIAAPSAGVFSFDYSTDGSDLSVFKNSGSQALSGAGSLSITLAAGEIFGFRAIADGQNFSLSQQSRAGVRLAGQGSQFLSIANPNFQSVPEASTLVAGLAGLGMLAWGTLRSRRQA